MVRKLKHHEQKLLRMCPIILLPVVLLEDIDEGG